jgi:hypothetical protein
MGGCTHGSPPFFVYGTHTGGSLDGGHARRRQLANAAAGARRGTHNAWRQRRASALTGLRC